ncbi:hypothetical protein BK140_17945 [Paenibacillus macerans]|uniref:amidase domain-containing protein n=1 Tax=Paenibacillus sp. FSL R5-0527 TaxID=2975321 RepID=UPI00097B9FC2|nr:hypothetical protein BK140_17945 [Paenibacillus macerans]
MTQCSCPFQQWYNVLVLSKGQELSSLKQKSRYISDFERNNVLVPRYLQTGDAVSLNTDTDADIDHTVIITKNTGNSSANKYITQHSWDHKEDRTLADMFSQGYGVYGYEIDKATN